MSSTLLERSHVDSAAQRSNYYCAAAISLYLLVSVFTGAWFMADTVDYVDSVVNHTEFWEFGHLLWRPIGWLALKIFYPVTHLFVGREIEVNSTLCFLAISWVAGLVCVVLLFALIREITSNVRLALAGTASLIVTQGFLNYSHTGAPYVPGLALALLSLYLAVKAIHAARSQQRSLGFTAGLSLGLAVCLWVPYIWFVPGLLLTIALLGRSSDQGVRFGLWCVVALAIIGAACYIPVIIMLGIRSYAGMREWIASASHGITHLGGISRAAFGFPRSFINMGNDGILFKRYLLHDPFSPVSLDQLLTLSLWKLCLFYAFLISVLANLLTWQRGRRLAALFAVAALPVLGFAVMFDGGAMERYLPLYPILFVALAASFSAANRFRILKIITAMFLISAAVSNLAAMALPVLTHRQSAVAARISSVAPLLKPGDELITLPSDELINFHRSYPFNPLNKPSQNLSMDPTFTLGTSSTGQWRQDLADFILRVWNGGNSIWISRRVFSISPQPEWGWVEKDDPRVSWFDVYGFFSRFEQGRTEGGHDGFTELPPSKSNLQFLHEVQQTPR